MVAQRSAKLLGEGRFLGRADEGCLSDRARETATTASSRCLRRTKVTLAVARAACLGCEAAGARDMQVLSMSSRMATMPPGPDPWQTDTGRRVTECREGELWRCPEHDHPPSQTTGASLPSRPKPPFLPSLLAACARFLPCNSKSVVHVAITLRCMVDSRVPTNMLPVGLSGAFLFPFGRPGRGSSSEIPAYTLTDVWHIL